jgi:hypothetical protein
VGQEELREREDGESREARARRELNRVARISPANLTGAAPDERHFPQTVP